MTKILLLLSLLCIAGCQDPRVPAPRGLRVPEGTPITITQYQAEIEHARIDAEKKQRADEVKAAREIRKIERETKNSTEDAIASAQDRVEEINETLSGSAFDRQSALDSLSDSLSQAKLDIENRQAFIVKTFQAANTIVGSGLIPGGELLLPLLGVAGAMFGLNKKKQLDQTKKDYESHVDAIDHAADVLPELKHALERAKPIIAEWQTPTSQKATEAYRAGVKP
jgi:hypothetical protein